jgi:ABC-type lipoprotein release transport system permease subunit
MPAFSPFLAIRYLLTRRINLLSVGGVLFAVWAMIVVNSVFTGFVSEIRTDVRNSAPDLLVTDLPHDTGYEGLRAVIEADAAVLASAPRLRHHGLCQPLRTPGGMSRPVAASEVDFDHTKGGFALLLGIDPIREAAVTDLQGWLQHGVDPLLRHFGIERPPSTVLDEPADRRTMLKVPDEVEWRGRSRAGLPQQTTAGTHASSFPGLLLGWRRAWRMPWVQNGDPIDLVTAAFVSDGNTSHLRTHRVRMAFAGWFSTGHRTFDETQAMLPIETLRTALGHDLADPGSIDLVTDIAIRLQPGTTATATAACKTRLRAAVQALLPAGSAPCSVLDWEEQNPVFLSAVAHEQAMMQFVLFVVMLVSAFVIYATLHMMVVQKWKDIGILAALGGTPRGIGAVYLLCGFVVAMVGALLGSGLGALSVHYLNDLNDWLFAETGLELFPRALFDLQKVPVRLETSWLLSVALGSMVLSLVVAYVPSRKASRMNPVKALSYE